MKYWGNFMVAFQEVEGFPHGRRVVWLGGEDCEASPPCALPPSCPNIWPSLRVRTNPIAVNLNSQAKKKKRKKFQRPFAPFDRFPLWVHRNTPIRDNQSRQVVQATLTANGLVEASLRKNLTPRHMIGASDVQLGPKMGQCERCNQCDRRGLISAAEFEARPATNGLAPKV
jgi:hypothetical protein